MGQFVSLLHLICDEVLALYIDIQCPNIQVFLTTCLICIETLLFDSLCTLIGRERQGWFMKHDTSKYRFREGPHNSSGRIELERMGVERKGGWGVSKAPRFRPFTIIEHLIDTHNPQYNSRPRGHY